MALQLMFSRVCAVNSTRFMKSPFSAFSMTRSGSDLAVEHDRNNLCFTITLDGAAEHLDSAVLRYKFTGEKEVDLVSTTVPESFRGKGVAATLSKAALDFLVKEKLKAHVSCWYIKKYIEENPHLGYKTHITGYS
ncbi:protein NATD1-like [Osmerus mordax]|uniref:protein NATD1-like n=1 Tax=Osmerus mordax TaxID=8014 RepID=UPI003510369B